MRRITAFSIVVLLALPAPVMALDDASSEPQRNPFVWLFEDIGSLLKAATNGTQTPKVEPEETQQHTDENKSEKNVSSGNADTIEFKNPLKALFSDLAKLFQSTETLPTEETQIAEIEAPTQSDSLDTQNQDIVEVSEAPSNATQRNPITWLFDDLAKLLTPTLEIDDRPAPPKTVELTEAAPASTPQVIVEETLVEDIAPAAEEAAPSPSKRNPISWLLSDLASMMSPEKTQANAIPEEKATPEAAAIVVETSVAVTSEITEVAKVNDAVTLMPNDIEPAPWAQTPRENMFDPADNIFDPTGAPLPVFIAAPKTEVVSVITPERPLRQRPPYRPGARNHRKLGSNHKSVTPDHVDEGIVANVLEQLFGIDVAAETSEPIANKISDRIIAEEKLDLGYTSPDAPDQTTELTNIGDGPLLDQDLYLGRGKLIGQPYKRERQKNAAACIERDLHGSIFCLEDLDWPALDAKSFDADTAFMMPGEAIIRYENGLSSRVYAVFNASQFADVVKIMQRRFGPPQEREIGWMHILEAPKLPNTTFRWKAVTPDRTDTIILEVRNYDDIRRSFADMDHGMVRLFRTGSRPIFKHISTMDLMLMQRRSAAQASSDVKTPQK